MTLLIAESTPK